MNIRQQADGWWIVNVPETEDYGPYDTRVEPGEWKVLSPAWEQQQQRKETHAHSQRSKSRS